MRNARHWDWLGQALDMGFLKGNGQNQPEITSKEQLLKERRQKILQERQSSAEPQVSKQLWIFYVVRKFAPFER